MNYLTDFYIDNFFNFMSEESVNSRRCKGGNLFFQEFFLYLFVWTGSLCVGRGKYCRFRNTAE